MYDHGAKFSGPLFAAFYLRSDCGVPCAKVGFTLPRAVGGAVVRNRLKRRMREAVRLRLDQLGSGWQIVFNPRRTVLAAPFAELEREVEKLFRRCEG